MSHSPRKPVPCDVCGGRARLELRAPVLIFDGVPLVDADGHLGVELLVPCPACDPDAWLRHDQASGPLAAALFAVAARRKAAG